VASSWSSYRLRRTGARTLLVAGVLACAGAPAAGAQAPEVVAEGLSNPRGMSFGPGGDLYVAESGRGGNGRCLPSGDDQVQCYGATGAITRVDVDSGRKTRIVRRLPSIAPQEGEAAGSGATGPNDVSFRGSTGYFTVGLAADPRRRARFGPDGRRLAGLYRISRRGVVSRVADLGAHEVRANPDDGQPGAEIDSNPYGVDATGPRLLVTDAGGNTLLRVSGSGRVSTLAVFPFGQAAPPPNIPNIPPGTMLPVQPVPTGLFRAANGSVVVGQLTGFPFPVGGASVFQVTGRAAPAAIAQGLTTVVDVARGPGGSIYALQITTGGLAAPPSPGKLVRIAPDGTQTELAAGQLVQPTGMAVARNGDIYVANQGTSARGGQVVRIPAG
jgi:sugar lactone lactonase YvrE